MKHFFWMLRFVTYDYLLTSPARMNSNQPSRPLERTVLVVALALLLFATPVIYGWARDDSPWFLIYFIWLIIIALSAWLYFTRSDDDI